MIPLRIITRDAVDEYDWTDFHDPFVRLKVPKAQKPRVCIPSVLMNGKLLLIVSIIYQKNPMTANSGWYQYCERAVR